MTKVNPVQTTTYGLTSNTQITTIFGINTNIDVTTAGGAGIYGNSSFDWQITNKGSIVGGPGIDLEGGGSIVNAVSGKISASGASDNGIYIKESGSITNSGLISAIVHAIYLEGGGTVVNTATGKIKGNIILTASGTVTNAGLIAGKADHYSDIDLEAGGEAKNSGTVRVSGTYRSGVYVRTTGTFTNSGTIVESGQHLDGIQLQGVSSAMSSAKNSGLVEMTGIHLSAVDLKGVNTSFTNGKAGVITASGSYISDLFATATASLTNVGVVIVSGSHTAGVELDAGGSFTNSGTVTDSGTDAFGSGVYFAAGGTLINQLGGVISTSRLRSGVFTAGSAMASITDAGLISGELSVNFTGSGPNYLTLQTGAELIGVAKGSLASATNDVTLEGQGSAANIFEGFNLLTVNAGATWTLTSIANFTQTVDNGFLKVSSTGSLSGDLTIDGGVAVFNSAFNGPVDFTGAGKLALAHKYTGTISGFGSGDKIDFLGRAFSAGDKLAISGSVLTLETATNVTLASVTIGGGYTLSDFAALGHDVAGNILVSHS